jgi:hypothetical protein
VGDTLAPKPRAVAEQAARDPAGVSYTVDVDA